MGPVLLQAVRARAPGVDIERSVLLLGPGVVVLERQGVPVGQPEVDLREPGPGVIRTGDGTEIARQLRIAGAEERCERVQRRARRPVLLLHVVVDLLVVREKIEDPVPLERAAQGETELTLGEVGLERRHLAGRVGVFRGSRQGVPLAEVVERALGLIGARLGNHVHKTTGGPAELGVRAARDHHHLLHGVQVEREGRPLATALLTEERVVEVRPVHRHVVVDPALARHRQLVAVRPLDDRDVRREQGQADEVSPVVRQARDDVRRQGRRRLGLRHIHHRLTRLDRHGGERDGRERQAQIHRLPHAEDNTRLLDFCEPDGTRGHLVPAEREQRAGEVAGRVGHQRAREVGLGLMQDHRRVGDGRAVRVRDHAADDAGGGLRLGAERRGRAEQHERRARQNA